MQSKTIFRGWQAALGMAVVVLGLGCGGGGGGGGGGGDDGDDSPLFEGRGQLNLVASVTSDDPTTLTLLVTLFSSQGNPLPNQLVSFAADFNDATFTPGSGNRGSVKTDDNGEAQVTLVAGLTTGQMRIVAEAFTTSGFTLDFATNMSVVVTSQGFISPGSLGIIPAAMTFVNPLVGPDVPGPVTTFKAVAGTPPYSWDNGNKSLGEIMPQGLPNVNEEAEYSLTGSVPDVPDSQTLLDTITLLDANGAQASAAVTVIVADCTLAANATEATLIAMAGSKLQVDVSDGVPPFSVSQIVLGSEEVHAFVGVEIAVIDENGDIIPGETCDAVGESCVVVFTLLPDIIEVSPGTILIRDASGCRALIIPALEFCGNGVINGFEQCDPPDFGGETCATLLGPGATGELFCDDNCTFDTSNCQ